VVLEIPPRVEETYRERYTPARSTQMAKLSVSEAADIWASNGKDEDYTFGYSEAELQAALDED
jgi:hypothetical protein